MKPWRRLNNLRWYFRCPIKIALLAIGVGLVLYPKPWLLPTVIHRGEDINSVLDPNNPGLAPLEAEVKALLPSNADAQAALPIVQRVVCQRVPYAFDWEVWGVVEYLPTVDEVLRAGREDCDGRAVVAASLLRRMGYKAWLVTDLLHMWVRTPQGETMSPTSTNVTVIGTESGSEVVYSLSMLHNLSRGMAFGVAVFPLLRELIIVAMICLLATQPLSSVRRRIVGCVLLLAALFLIRHAGHAAAIEGDARDVTITVAGVVLALAGWITLMIRAATQRPRCESALPG